jgi:hypothetical protein
MHITRTPKGAGVAIIDLSDHDASQEQTGALTASGRQASSE